MAEFMNVGKIVNTHGIRGEVRIMPLTDFPEVRFAKNAELFFFTPDNHPVMVNVESSRLHKNMYILRLKEYGNINEVEKFKGGMAKVLKENLAELTKVNTTSIKSLGVRSSPKRVKRLEPSLKF